MKKPVELSPNEWTLIYRCLAYIYQDVGPEYKKRIAEVMESIGDLGEEAATRGVAPAKN